MLRLTEKELLDNKQSSNRILKKEEQGDFICTRRDFKFKESSSRTKAIHKRER